MTVSLQHILKYFAEGDNTCVSCSMHVVKRNVCLQNLNRRNHLGDGSVMYKSVFERNRMGRLDCFC